MMFGWGEGAVVLGVIVLLFGAKRIPELMRSLGSGVKEFRQAAKEAQQEAPPQESEATPPPAEAATKEKK